jgi:hypothetical protein
VAKIGKGIGQAGLRIGVGDIDMEVRNSADGQRRSSLTVRLGG